MWKFDFEISQLSKLLLDVRDILDQCLVLSSPQMRESFLEQVRKLGALIVLEAHVQDCEELGEPGPLIELFHVDCLAAVPGLFREPRHETNQSLGLGLFSILFFIQKR